MFQSETAEQKELNRICYEVRGAIFEVFKHLGPGLLEILYEEAMVIELEDTGLKVQRQLQLPVYFKGRKLKTIPRLDLLVEGKVLLELKSIEAFHPIHFKKMINYLRLSKTKVGYLVNFNVPLIEDKKSLIRIVNHF